MGADEKSLSSRGEQGSSERDVRRHSLTKDIARIILSDGLGDLGLRGLASRLQTSGRMLLYYFGGKERLIVDVLDQVSADMAVELTQENAGPRLPPGQFLARAIAMSTDPRLAPYMKL